MRRLNWIGRACFAAWLVGVPTASQGTEPGSPQPERVDAGRSLYRIYCENCHGESGRGNGPTAELLHVEPADLTRLTKQNQGAFPLDEIHRVIDGRKRVRGHGARQMPIWGLAFQEFDRDVNQEGEVRRRIELLIDYLKSMQQGPG